MDAVSPRAANFNPYLGGQLLRFTIATLVCLFAVLVSSRCEVMAQDGDSPPMMVGINAGEGGSVASAERLLKQKQFDQAAELALQISVAEIQSNPSLANRHLVVLARIGRAIQQSGDLPLAAKLYDRAIEIGNTSSSDEIASKRTMLHLARLSIATKTKDDVSMAKQIAELSANSDSLQPSQAHYVARTAIELGGRRLSEGDWETASTAYRIGEMLGGKTQSATAMLGSAWSLVISGEQPAAAAEKLDAFLVQHIDHPDAAQAMRVQARCFAELGQEKKAQRKLIELISRWPESESAVDVVISHMDVPTLQLPDEVRDWLHHHAKTPIRETWSAELTAFAIETISDTSSAAVRESLLRQLMESDTNGTQTTRLLDRVSQSDGQSIAAQFLSPPASVKVAAAVREAACRWAGRHQHWSLIAAAAELESPQQVTEGRSATIERLFAESLMQTGRTRDALGWWNHVVDNRQASDFSTLLRCAEAETAAGDDISLAEQRLTAARQAADADTDAATKNPSGKLSGKLSGKPSGNAASSTFAITFAITLVDLLEAELAIRRSQFDTARSLLENVVRGSEAGPGLRGRAQWMIGETHFLQHQFHEAIDAYRQVEGMDADGPWVAASFVQAGKAFEQLGRTREASVCYGNLIRRFADSPHADVARNRIAAISPLSTEQPTSSIRR